MPTVSIIYIQARGYKTLKIVLLINLKSLPIANSFLLNIAEHDKFSANTYEIAKYLLAEKI